MKRAGLLAVVIIACGAIMMGWQSRLIFYPERLAADVDFELPRSAEEVQITTSDKEVLSAVLHRAQSSQGVILYFHGNAGSLRTWKDVSSDFVPLGYDTLVLDYRGYGKSTGRITEAGLYEDGRAAYRWLIQQGYHPDDVVIYGRSIGSGVASKVVSEVEARALILESPFSSLVTLGRELMPWALPGLTLRFRFPNEIHLAQTSLPVLLVHGRADELIGAHHSERLAEVLGERAELHLIEGGAHNDLAAFAPYHRAIAAFLASHRSGGAAHVPTAEPAP
ncbi:alpha/beta hydrolase [Lujinxingia sediminis]|uniref:Alpha/beta hydrolase n=1 Tax=Lujinxingia sediminis TaxID=2480984 RepID=A0ABY0CX47_9DELT|nr:alpha/beta hydrolase [Lujinxingia sediminis]RVU48472.1 alpha/beta hydrolase [Lujinxingia sediminis]